VLRRLAIIAVCILLPSLASGQSQPSGRAREPIIGGPCEGCEGVFEGLPATLASATRIARAGEPGQPMVIDGVVRNTRGAPVAGVIVYAYHTDASGIYRPIENAPGSSARRHGQLRGWAMTDSLGRYRFITIRPGHYPQRNAAQHVHMHVTEPGCCTYYLGSIVFRDDPLLTDAARDETRADRGGSGLATPTRGADGVWHVRRDIRLGAGVPGYDEARRRRP
jgi:protocatechuate 3,4-dioxygenase beta subunit